MSVNFRRLQERLRESLLQQINAGELSGQQLARATGFQQAHISNFLNRKRGLSLEAMDAILHATGITIGDLLPQGSFARLSISASAHESTAFVAIPIVKEQLCVATQVPKQSERDTLWLASEIVQQMRPAMNIPRPHWQRFVAIRVKASDVAALSPRLAPRTIAVVDRHHNAPSDHIASNPDMFLIRTSAGFVIRYLETVAGKLLARPHAPGFALQAVEAFDGNHATASIIGRICVLQVHL